MTRRNRREFLADVGRGMLVAGVGSTLAADLGLARAAALDADRPLVFSGGIEPLAALMQETEPTALLPILVEKLRGGVGAQALVRAGALANARTFGGQDYTGYHALMALPPALDMAGRLPEAQRALPILKVLYRNTDRIRAVGGRSREALHPVEPLETSALSDGEPIREATRAADLERAERTMAALCEGPPDEAFHHLQFSVQDEVDVHRVVLAWRAWELLGLCGAENAETLLRQSVRYCVDTERHRIDQGRPTPEVREVLPALMEQHGLMAKGLGDRRLSDGEVERLAATIYGSPRDQAAGAAAEALADGVAPADVAEAMAIAANLLVLRDPGRSKADGPEKPIGSVHGASVGVHASDAANAWRNIALVSRPRNVIASLLVGAFHTAGQSGGQHDRPYPFPEDLDRVEDRDPAALLRGLDGAIRENDQARSCAIVRRHQDLGHDPGPVLDLLLRHGTSEDGALHAEKYFRTVTEEYRRTRPAFRGRQLVALARVTASEYGRRAPGYDQACELLGIA